MRRRGPPDLVRLRNLYSYNPKTGLFVHRHSRYRVVKGEVAGSLRTDGYIKMVVDGAQYLAHHLAWYIYYEEWVLELDHINRRRSENWIKNLRPATRAQNNGNNDGWAQEKRKHKLPRGVYTHPCVKGRYRAQIVADRKQIHLGCFATVKEAEMAYKEAANKYFGEFAP